MKYAFTLLLGSAIVFFSSCGTQSTYDGSGYTINAALDNLPSGQVVLFTYDEIGNQIRIDSTNVSRNKFSFSGEIEQPSMHYLHYSRLDSPIPIFLENANIEITGDATQPATLVIDGGVEQKLYNQYSLYMKAVSDSMGRLDEQYSVIAGAGDLEGIDLLESEYMRLIETQKTFIKEFAAAHTDRAVSPYVILRNLYFYEYDDITALSDAINQTNPEGKYAVSLREQVEVLSSVQIGRKAPDFALPTPEGENLQLSDLRGEYLLVDFWASWCGPCRQENPNVVAAYNAYNEKGFNVLGVSLDRVKSKWEEAIQSDALHWHHISDLKGWSSSAAKLYGIRSIPFSLLLDKEGTIIARNLQGEELWHELEKLLGPAG